MQIANHAKGWRFLLKSGLVVALGLITSITAQRATAVDVFTDPVGFISLTAVGSISAGAGPLSYWGLGMTQLVTNRGLLTAISGTKLTVNNTLTASAFNSGPLGPLYFIEITSGAHPGLIDDVVSNDTANVFTASNNSGLIAGTESYKLYPHWTLAKAFGASDEAGLAQGTASTADQILVPNPLTQTYPTYFYATATKTLSAGWKLVGGGNTDQAQTPLPIDQGILIKKATGTNLTVKLVGAVKLGTTIEPLSPLNNFAANVYASSAKTLGTAQLFNGGNQTNSVVDGSASTADLVLIHNDVTGAYSTYFFATATKTLSAGWKQVGGGNTDASGTAIPLGANVLVQIKTPRPGFNWTPTAPY